MSERIDSAPRAVVQPSTDTTADSDADDRVAKRNIADAMLAARFFADSLGPNELVYQGPAAMDIRQALDIILSDSRKLDKALISPLTRFRLCGAIADGLARRIVPYLAAWEDRMDPYERFIGPKDTRGRGEKEKILRKAALGRAADDPSLDTAFEDFFDKVGEAYNQAVSRWSAKLAIPEYSPSDAPPTILSAYVRFDDLIADIRDAISRPTPELSVLRARIRDYFANELIRGLNDQIRAARRSHVDVRGKLDDDAFEQLEQVNAQRIASLKANIKELRRSIDDLDETSSPRWLARLTDRWLQLTTESYLDRGRSSYRPEGAFAYERSRVRRDLDLLDIVLSIKQAYRLVVQPSIADPGTDLEFRWAGTNPDQEFPPLLRVTWHTDMDVDWRGQLIVRGTMRLHCDRKDTAENIYAIFSDYCDPREWAGSSPFWIQSDRCDERGVVLLPEKERYNNGEPFYILEAVRGVTQYDVILDVAYDTDACKPKTDAGRCTMPAPSDGSTRIARTLTTYRLQDQLRTDLTKDEGYIEIELRQNPTVDERGRPLRGDVYLIEGAYVKVLDFLDNPYGGPGTTDLIAPSYVGSWVRTQLDLWASKAEKSVEAVVKQELRSEASSLRTNDVSAITRTGITASPLRSTP